MCAVSQESIVLIDPLNHGLIIIIYIYIIGQPRPLGHTVYDVLLSTRDVMMVVFPRRENFVQCIESVSTQNLE